MMKPRLQTSLGQQLVLTPQLRQALHVLQLPTLELEAEIAAAVESNPLLDWNESPPLQLDGHGDGSDERSSDPRDAADDDRREAEATASTDDGGWDGEESAWRVRGDGGDEDGEAGDRTARIDSLADHLGWQLHLATMSARDRRIGEALVDAIDDDGYLRETFASIAETLAPGLRAGDDEILAVLRQVQRFDPTGVGARGLGECLALQLEALPAGISGRGHALTIATTLIDRLPRLGSRGVADALGCSEAEATTALQLLRTLDPRPGARMGGMPLDTYVVPDCVVTRQNGMWRVALATGRQSRVSIHRGYEQMIRHAGAADAGYLRGRLQEARWLLKNLEQRGETLLKVMRCLVRQQSGFLEFGPQALRPLTLREVAAEVGMHESTVSRAVARKHVRTPRGTIALRSFFASGIDTGGGGEASSTAIQDMIRRLVAVEDPRRPLSDARLADMLKANGVPVARRTVAKYREALNIPSSHDRVRVT